LIVLDTDVVIEIIDKKSVKGSAALRKVQASGESIAITSITLHEVLYGLDKYARPVNEILQIPVASYGKEDAVLSTKLEQAAEKKGATVRRADAMIAAVAMNRNAPLYTFDRHFAAFREAGLRLFDRQAP
jgi:predicted nucleic acid-binding protein